MGYKGRFADAKPSGGRWKSVIVVVVCVVVILGSLALAGYAYLDSKLDKITQAKLEDKGTNSELDAMAQGGKELEPIPTETEPEKTEPTEPSTEEATEATEPNYGESGKIINIMVVGQDFREDEGHKLADTLMLFTLNKENRTLTVTSFLRDSYVKLPEYYRGHTCGWNRINTSYALGYGWFGDEGAMEMLNLTIEGNYGIEIDGNVEISLDSFEIIIDLLGGVDIELFGDELAYMNAVADVYYKPHFVEGVNHLSGESALWYARMRHSNGEDNDIKRAGRQRLIIDKVIQKCKSMSIFDLNNILDQVLPTIITNISKDNMKMYIAEALPYIFDIQLVSNQCPAEGTYWGEMVELPDGLGGVLRIDFYQNQKRLAEICSG